ncbi:MAG: septum site-determining protein Ssd [Sporichthyaceae bacterium]
MTAARPLIVTADDRLLDDLLHLADQAGVEPHVQRDAFGDRNAWAAASLVIVGTDALAGAVRARLPWRAGVLVVGCEPRDRIPWERVRALGVECVIALPTEQGWLAERIARTLEPSAPCPVVCVVGGRGGAGASTLAAALGLAATRLGLHCVLLDADPLGGGLDLLMGVENGDGWRWADLGAATGTPSTDLAALLPRVPAAGPGDLQVLSAGRDDGPDIPADTMRSVLATATAGAELVVVDLPRTLGPAARAALTAADSVLLVVPADLRSTVAAGRVLDALGPGLNLHVVVRGPAPSGLTPAIVAGSLGLPLAGSVRADRRLPAETDRGTPPGARPGSPWADFALGYLHRQGAGRRGAA